MGADGAEGKGGKWGRVVSRKEAWWEGGIDMVGMVCDIKGFAVRTGRRRKVG